MKQMKPQTNHPCTWCKEGKDSEPKKTRADWRSGGLSFVKYACTEHVEALRKHEASNSDDGRMSEADRQSWGRL